MSKKFWIIAIIIAIVAIVVIFTKKKSAEEKVNEQPGTNSQENKIDKVQWLIDNIGKKNIVGLYKLYIWYRDHSQASNPYGSAKWDLHTNHKVGTDTTYDFTKEQSVAMDSKGITLEDLLAAYEKVK